MYIIQDVPGELPHYHRLGSVSLDDAVSVTVSTTKAEPMPGPGGSLLPFLGSGIWTVPEGAIPEDNVSKASVADWLVGEDGPYPGGLICSDADFPWQSERMALLAKVRTKRDMVRDGGCLVDIHGDACRVETDATSRVNISGSVVVAMLALQSGDSFSTDWRMADNSIIALDAADMIQLGKTVAAFVEAGQRRKNELDALVETITADGTEEELADIKAQLLTGWPE